MSEMYKLSDVLTVYHNIIKIIIIVGISLTQKNKVPSYVHDYFHIGISQGSVLSPSVFLPMVSAKVPYYLHAYFYPWYQPRFRTISHPVSISGISQGSVLSSAYFHSGISQGSVLPVYT